MGFGGRGYLSPIPRTERITLGDTSSGPVSERPTWHSYSASSLRSHASICRWNSPAGRTQGQGHSQLLLTAQGPGSDPLPLVGLPARWYRGKPGILGSGPRSSPSLAHCTVLPGALTPHRSSAAAPSITVVFSGRAQKPLEAEAGICNWARPVDTEKSAGEDRGSVWRM